MITNCAFLIQPSYPQASSTTVFFLRKRYQMQGELHNEVSFQFLILKYKSEFLQNKCFSRSILLSNSQNSESMVFQECWKNVLFLNLFWLCLLDSLSYMLLEQSVLCHWECYWHSWFITDFMIHDLTAERFKQKNWDVLRRAASLQRKPQDLGKHGDSEKDRLVSTIHRWVSWTGYKDGHCGHRRKTLARSNV